eukprot:Plantae.Rhodophyta-Hildenbrandia_rubra.ctg11696.p1 GENE.Plantae.Rhodophyta-Hildenbrandia_rubra.ctg11696~~Plantae.Rhodophyta-Hildenbrandia_rubra.ctg11696.p1  ORF type:complete len:417 (+),score=58.71 Plantae.Rhodophyta-Hildenbrandia_rubra.ctg11696:123-1373(+)
MSLARPMRDYIRKLLYASDTGYFSRAGGPILRSKGFDFKKFRNRGSYEEALATVYKDAAHAWMTPTEKFRPHYAHVMCNRILASDQFSTNVTKRSTKTRNVYEIGGGNGTMAFDVLNLFKKRSIPIHYTLVEISEVLANKQRLLLDSFIKDGCCKVVCADATTWNGWVDDSIILILEVLDNLPHDCVRLVSQNDIDKGEHSEMEHCVITEERQAAWVPLSDPDTIAAFDAFNLDNALDPLSLSSSPVNSFFHYLTVLATPKSRTFRADKSSASSVSKVLSPDIWVPTCLHRLLKTLAGIPGHSLTIADFTHFPGCLPGINAPAVQQIKSGKAFLYDTVEKAPPGKVDVLFPTDFERLKIAYEGEVPGKNVKIASHEEFVQEYASEDSLEDTSCTDKYNPMLSEFQNVAVLTADSSS